MTLTARARLTGFWPISFRQAFAVAESQIQMKGCLNVHRVRDDGVIVYLNDVEMIRYERMANS